MSLTENAPAAANDSEPPPWMMAGIMSAAELSREPIDVIPDIPYAASDHPRQLLDLYLPQTLPSLPLPLIVFIHGGGWFAGDKAMGAGRLVPFVRTGHYAAASIGYRVSGEATWPAQIHDCKAAIRWLRAQASRYRFDSQSIAVWGSSAGGHLALIVGFTADNPELEGALGAHLNQSSAVSAIVNYFGATDLVAIIDQPSMVDRHQPDSPEAMLLGGPLLENLDKARAASPLTHIRPGAPPIFTLHGDADTIVPYDQSVRLHRALTDAHIPSTFITVQGGDHAIFPEAALPRVEAFLANALLGQNKLIDPTPLNAED